MLLKNLESHNHVERIMDQPHLLIRRSTIDIDRLGQTVQYQIGGMSNLELYCLQYFTYVALSKTSINIVEIVLKIVIQGKS